MKKATKAATIKHPVVAALYESHVEHILALLTGDGLEAHLSEEIDADLANAAKLKLSAVVSRDLVKATAATYAIHMPMSGGIPELVGDIARALHAHPIHDSTRLTDVISDQQVKEIINKAVEMEEVRDRLLHEVLGNPLLADLASDLIYRGIKGYLAQGNEAAKGIPGASSLMSLGKTMLSKASPGLEKSLDEGLLSYVRKNTKATLRMSEDTLKKKLNAETLRSIALDVWADIKLRPASSLRQFVSAESLEEMFVIGYEYWRADLRNTPYYAALLDIGIDGFYDKYGDETLAVVLEEVGVTRDMILTEVMRYAPPVLAALSKTGMLDGIVRRQLLPFYSSGRVEAVLAAQEK